MAWDLNGRAVLITGAARGIGAESARRLAARGARVALVGLEPEELERVAAECPAAVFFEADVTDHGALAAAVDGTVDALGGIDVVIANAGIGTVGFARSMDPEAFERTLEVNLLGVWRTVRACLPHVIERRGYVLNVASSRRSRTRPA
jgi:NAD(P)-dependent dehydrogenase (short-subunit alcohol dehydrogenase family)